MEVWHEKNFEKCVNHLYTGGGPLEYRMAADIGDQRSYVLAAAVSADTVSPHRIYRKAFPARKAFLLSYRHLPLFKGRL